MLCFYQKTGILFNLYIPYMGVSLCRLRSEISKCLRNAFVVPSMCARIDPFGHTPIYGLGTFRVMRQTRLS